MQKKKKKKKKRAENTGSNNFNVNTRTNSKITKFMLRPEYHCYTLLQKMKKETCQLVVFTVLADQGLKEK